MTLTSDQIRKLNLIEVLTEEAEASGRPVPELPDDAPTTWTEEQIRQHFALTPPGAGIISSRAALPEPAPAAGLARSSFPAPSQELFSKWFPGLKLSGTGCSAPRLRVLCFPSAGNAQDMYTSEGTGSRRAPSPLLEWCRAHQAEMLAVEPPGRAARSKEQQYSSLQQLAAALLPVVASRLADGTPYVVVAHSLGTWMAFELLQLVRQAGLPLPAAAWLSAMPSPDIPLGQRPWRQQRSLDEQQFKEECRGWDINDVVFSAGLWPLYQPLLRADFRLFDEYELRWPVAPLLHCPVTTFYGSRDRRVKEHMVQGWSRFISGPFRCQQVEGHHLWPLYKGSKAAWLGHIVGELHSQVAAAMA